MDNKEKIRLVFEQTNKVMTFGELAEQAKEARQALVPEEMPVFHIECLDKRLKKIKHNSLTIFGAYSSTGKTQLANNIVIQNAKKGKVVLYFMLEWDVFEIYERYMATEISKDMPLNKIDYSLNIDTTGLIKRKEDELYKRIDKNIMDNLLIYKKDKIPDMQEIVNIVSALSNRVDLIAIDHLQYISLPDDASENKALSDMMQTAKNITDNLRKPVIIFSHLRKKDGKQKEKPLDMDDLHWSSNIFKQANNVILFEPVRWDDGMYYKNKDWNYVTRFVIAKSRVWSGANRDTSYMEYSQSLQAYTKETEYKPVF